MDAPIRGQYQCPLRSVLRVYFGLSPQPGYPAWSRGNLKTSIMVSAFFISRKGFGDGRGNIKTSSFSQGLSDYIFRLFQPSFGLAILKMANSTDNLTFPDF
jgi:hypothetical protein